jgi:hypothetical protein
VCILVSAHLIYSINYFNFINVAVFGYKVNDIQKQLLCLHCVLLVTFGPNLSKFRIGHLNEKKMSYSVVRKHRDNPDNTLPSRYEILQKNTLKIESQQLLVQMMCTQVRVCVNVATPLTVPSIMSIIHALS